MYVESCTKVRTLWDKVKICQNKFSKLKTETTFFWNSRNLPKTVQGNIVWMITGRLEVYWIMYQSLHNVRWGQNLSDSRQVFKVENQNKKCEIQEF